MSALLQVQNLSKRYQTVRPSIWPRIREGFRRDVGPPLEPPQPPGLLHAVDDVSFSIMPGESVGLVGESGCGKSTLVKLITRLIDPTGGHILFREKHIGDVKARQFASMPERAKIQKVFQDPTDSLNPRYQAFDIIADPLRRLTDLKGAKMDERVRELAGLVALPGELLHRYPHQLSGGQKARVGIARALALDPALLILDEPTSALDVSVQAVILHLLADLRKKLGMSYLFVSHDLNVVRLLCDRVLVMYSGKIVESGPAETLFRNPRHPYTQALVSAIPSADKESARIRLDGEARSPIDPDPNVCRLYGRCPNGVALCAERRPEMIHAGDNQEAACHFPRSLESMPA
jgi:oligopeptide/dipeptide ABC transporter ATP-binding protein